jgi:C4-type Zn-finger protein
MTPVDFTINSAPVSISLECPHCESEIEIPWKDLDVPDYWFGTWSDVECLECGKKIELGECEYD